MHDNKTSLPIDPFSNITVLRGSTDQALKIYFGTDRWGRKEWTGNIYPWGAKEREFLQYYVQHFNGIDLQATQYMIYPPEQITKWARCAANVDFKFCARMPQTISHYGHFSYQHSKDELRSFFDALSGFKSHLGPILFKPSDKVSTKRKDAFFDLLSKLPKEKTFFVSLGNADWYEEENFNELTRFLKKNNLGLAINDNNNSGLLKLDLTIEKAYVRYDVDNGDERLESWVDQMRNWGTRGMTEAYFFVYSTDAMKTLAALQKLKTLIGDQ